MNGTSDVMKTSVIDNSVAFTTAISVGIVLGIFTTFIVIISLIVILRRRRYVKHFWPSSVGVLLLSIETPNSFNGHILGQVWQAATVHLIQIIFSQYCRSGYLLFIFSI